MTAALSWRRPAAPALHGIWPEISRASLRLVSIRAMAVEARS
jgi:hypothetical protein